ncbi:hypothetical protein GTO10_06295 [Candidatus Saccharibacteria bacterium]|nr:hypothetical protein [Candidatus Saccharibacteria bacterium]
MRKIGLLLSVCALSVSATGFAVAQERGIGVGALFTNVQGDTAVSVANVKTAPWSEVIIENSSEELQVVAKLDEQGLVNFTFQAKSADVGSLFIYAVDEAGVTNKIQIEGTTLSDEILPPTIVSTESEDEQTVVFNGYSYPNAKVSVLLTSDKGYNNTFTQTATAVTGAWELTVDALENGNYTATASASIFGETSQASQELYFTIEAGGLVNIVVTQAGPIISAIAQGVEDFTEAIAKAAQNLPDFVKKASNTVSKAAVPVSLITLLLQAGISSLNDLALFFQQHFLSLLRIPLIPFLIGKRGEKKHWGVVYDAFTKQPLSQSLVRLLTEGGKFVDMEITNRSGTFSFLPSTGKYKLETQKAGYTFPSQRVTVKKDGEYDNVYRGEIIETKEKEPTVARSVPLDPKTAEEGAKVRRTFKKHGPSLNIGLLTIGLVLSTISYLVSPVLYNQLATGFYVVTLSFVTVGAIRIERTWGIVKDETGNTVEGVALSLVEAETGKLVKRRVTNEQGRYQFITGMGRYKILIASVDWERIDQKGYYTGEEIVVSAETEIINTPLSVRQKPETALKRRETI